MADLQALLDDLQARGIRLWASDGALHFEGPAGALSPALRAAVAEAKTALLKRLAEVPAAPVSGQRTVSRRPRAGTRPVDRLNERVPSPGAVRQTSRRAPAPTIPATAVVGASAVDVAPDLDPPPVQKSTVVSAPSVADAPAPSSPRPAPPTATPAMERRGIPRWIELVIFGVGVLVVLVALNAYPGGGDSNAPPPEGPPPLYPEPWDHDPSKPW